MHQRYHPTAKSLSPLEQYFLRPKGQYPVEIDSGNHILHNFDDLTFNQYCQLFHLAKYDAQSHGAPRYFEERAHDFPRMHVIQRKQGGHPSRIHFVNPSKGELFYLR